IRDMMVVIVAVIRLSLMAKRVSGESKALPMVFQLVYASKEMIITTKKRVKSTSALIVAPLKIRSPELPLKTLLKLIVLNCSFRPAFPESLRQRSVIGRQLIFSPYLSIRRKLLSLIQGGIIAVLFEDSPDFRRIKEIEEALGIVLVLGIG